MENEWVDTAILSYACEYSLTWKLTFISFLMSVNKRSRQRWEEESEEQK